MGRHQGMKRWENVDLDQRIIVFVRTTLGTTTMAQLRIMLEVRAAFASSDEREIDGSLRRLKKQGLMTFDMHTKKWSYVEQSGVRSVSR